MEKEELKALDSENMEQVSGGGEKWDKFKASAGGYASEYASKGAEFAKKHKRGLAEAGAVLGTIATVAGAAIADQALTGGKGREKLFRKLGNASDYDTQKARATAFEDAIEFRHQMETHTLDDVSKGR